MSDTDDRLRHQADSAQQGRELNQPSYNEQQQGHAGQHRVEPHFADTYNQPQPGMTGAFADPGSDQGPPQPAGGNPGYYDQAAPAHPHQPNPLEHQTRPDQFPPMPGEPAYATGEPAGSPPVMGLSERLRGPMLPQGQHSFAGNNQAGSEPSLEQLYGRLEQTGDGRQPYPGMAAGQDYQGYSAGGPMPGDSGGQYHHPGEPQAPDYMAGHAQQSAPMPPLHAGPELHQGGHQDHYAPAHADHMHGDARAEQLLAAAPGRTRSRTMLIGGVMSVALLMGGGLAYAYKYTGIFSGGGNGKVPVIKAAKAPVKVKPANAGGKKFPNRNKQIYARLGKNNGTQNERLVPRKETVSGRLLRTANSGGGLSSGLRKSIDAVAGNPQKSARLGGMAKPMGTSVGRPRKVRTLIVKPDGTIVQPTEPSGGDVIQPIGFAPAPAKPAKVMKPAPMKAMKKAIKASPPKRIAKVQPRKITKPKAIKREPTTVASTNPRRKPSARVASKFRGKYVVQVAARRDQTSALEAFANMQQKYSTILGTYGPLIQRADLGDRGVFYRLRVGPVASKNGADSLCGKLKQAGLKSCFVRPM